MSTRHITGPAQKKYIEDTLHVKSRNTGRSFPQKKIMPVWGGSGVVRCLQLHGRPTLMGGGRGLKPGGEMAYSFFRRTPGSGIRGGGGEG